MNEKQQQLTFDKGITNVPSDALCSDNALEESLGMVYDNGEHRVIQSPVLFMANAPQILYVHKVYSKEIFIALADDSDNKKKIIWGTNNSGQWLAAPDTTPRVCYSGNPLMSQIEPNGLQVTAIGNTLIIKNDSAINYFLWDADIDNATGGYIHLGNKLPDVDIRFRLNGSVDAPIWGNSGGHADCLLFSSGSPVVSDQKTYNDLVIGLYSKNKKDGYQNRRFVNPFAIRYAFELYDGTYTHASAPIMMFPSVQENTKAEYTTGEVINDMRLITDGAYLQYMRADEIDLSIWSDIIKDIVVFVSDEVEIYELIGDIVPRKVEASTLWKDGVIIDRSTQKMTYMRQWTVSPSSTPGTNYFLPFTRRTNTEIVNDLKDISVFYRAFAIGTTTAPNNWNAAYSKIEKHTLENITTQEQLPDDYFSHSVMGGDNIFSYNNRLLLANVTRSYFEGHHHFLPYDGSSYSWIIEVKIKTPSGNKIVRKTITSTEIFGAWYFFYPDSRAIEAKIYRDNHLVKTLTLEDCPRLNGAIYMNGLPTSTPTYPSDGDAPDPTQANFTAPAPERLYNQIWVSEVNDPFVFRAEGNITVGNGDILGISTLTQAISQGQFGQYPLIVFTSEGIWAASTGNTGLFNTVHPMSREVCNNPKSITQTDGAVFFSSEKGLMVVVGSDVKNMSEQMAGRTQSFKVLVDGVETEQLVDMGNFMEYLKNSFIAYDYRDSLLWIFEQTHRTCYVYSIKSGTFGEFQFTNAITSVINLYPDYLLQSGTNVYSLLKRPDINSDGTISGSTFTPNTYRPSLITRPMKLEDATALKSIMQTRHIYDMNDNATLSLRIFASNNLKHWVELHSLRGTPWKYYRFRFDFTNMIATDRFAGTMLITQERRTNKLR